MDLADGNYKLGATYEWDDLDSSPTASGKAELLAKLKGMITCGYEVRKHEAGVRPSSGDRRPIIGQHPAIPGMYIFNGLGTKGMMLAPWFAANFVNFCQQKGPLHPDVDVGRFYTLYDAGKKA